MLMRAQVVFRHVSNLAEDRVVNTFHFDIGVAVEAGELEAMAELVRDFYVTNVGAPATQQLSEFLGFQIADTGHEVRCYTLNEADGTRLTYEGAPPDYVEAFDFVGDTRPSLAHFPSEVACKLTLRNTTEVSIPLARRTGGVYIGPLNLEATSNVGGQNEVRPSTDLINTMLAAGDWLATQAEAAGNALVVYSRPYAGRGEIVRPGRTTLPALPARAGVAYPVTQVSVDDALDTQRRRGRAATSRSIALV